MHDIQRQARSLRFAATVLMIVAIVCSILGVLAGAAISSAGTDTHTAAGNAVILAAILLGTLGWCVSRAIGVFATDIAVRNGVDINERPPSRLPEFLQR